MRKGVMIGGGLVAVALVAVAVVGLSRNVLDPDEAPRGPSVESAAQSDNFQAIRAENAALFDILEREFPEDYEAFAARVTQTINGADPAEQDRIVAEAAAQLRRTHAQRVLNAPDDHNRAILASNAVLTRFVLDRTDPRTCATFVAQGPIVLIDSPIAGELSARLEPLSNQVMDAIVTGKNAPVERERATQEDWQTVLGAMAETQADIRRIRVMTGDGRDVEPEELCDAAIFFVGGLSGSVAPGAERVRADAVYGIIGN